MTKELDLETRREIFELVSDFPGLHFREILRRLGLSSGTLSYQLHYLTKHDILVAIQDGNLKRYYVVGEIKGKDKRILASLRNELTRGLVLFLLLNPSSQLNDIASHFDLSRSTLSYHLNKLADKKVIEKERRGRKTYYKVVDEEAIAKVLISYRPSFLDSIVEKFIAVWEER